MKIRSSDDFGQDRSRFDAAAADETLAELEAQYAAGELERHAYFLKKRALVRQFMKATTNPSRRLGSEGF
ncbi:MULTISPECIES: hypothetical protein [Leucobacter]|uniref:Uncharacterized protein n=1 Tax=Leucobacter chromiiresistens TaxID=1079994 RepID=A0A1H0YF97_9MICO|nr:hypothetical protein [Leucobacter chromiiresistens]SDQ13905.1 hypothetical protein SAMN04488565_0825 [Leucobacter chromiiresistens]